jgi:hypothetical protein
MGNPGIPGRTYDFRDRWGALQLPAKGMFTTSATNDQYFHFNLLKLLENNIVNSTRHPDYRS